MIGRAFSAISYSIIKRRNDLGKDSVYVIKTGKYVDYVRARSRVSLREHYREEDCQGLSHEIEQVTGGFEGELTSKACSSAGPLPDLTAAVASRSSWRGWCYRTGQKWLCETGERAIVHSHAGGSWRSLHQSFPSDVAHRP